MNCILARIQGNKTAGKHRFPAVLFSVTALKLGNILLCIKVGTELYITKLNWSH